MVREVGEGFADVEGPVDGEFGEDLGSEVAGCAGDFDFVVLFIPMS